MALIRKYFSRKATVSKVGRFTELTITNDSGEALRGSKKILLNRKEVKELVIALVNFIEEE